jgi:PAS domain S-box-containing protein
MIIIELIYDVTILVAISVVSGIISQQWGNRRREFFLQGIIFGTAAVIGMMRPVVLEPGLIFDGRSIMISLCGLFFGPVAAAIAGGMAIIYRVFQGGIGAVMGVSVIIFSALTGVFFYYRLKKINSLRLLVFGIIVHIGMLLLTFTLPFNVAISTLKNIGLPVILTYPLITILIGKVLSDQKERRLYLETLHESEVRLNKSQELAHLGSWDFDMITKKMNWSDEVYRIFGFKPHEFKPANEYFLDVTHPEDRVAVDLVFFELRHKNLDSNFINHRIVRKHTGEVRYVYQKFEQIRDASGNIIKRVGMIQDITERRLSEERIKKLFEEKEVLLREVHHRIKNNMSTMMGLLSLQADSTNDAESVEILYKAKNRMQSMAVLYDKLYRSDNFREMSIKEYLLPLIAEIIEIFPNKENVKIETQIEDFIIDINILSPIGIIINELITNAMKHAFPDRDDGIIIVEARIEDADIKGQGNNVSIVIQDNGSGLDDSVDIESTAGFGLKLIGLLVKQLRGKISIERGKGTKYIMKFDI